MSTSEEWGAPKESVPSKQKVTDTELGFLYGYAALPVITPQMLEDFGQEGFFERTEKKTYGVPGWDWSQAIVDFACLLKAGPVEKTPDVLAENLELRAALEYIASNFPENPRDYAAEVLMMAGRTALKMATP